MRKNLCNYTTAGGDGVTFKDYAFCEGKTAEARILCKFYESASETDIRCKYLYNESWSSKGNYCGNKAAVRESADEIGMGDYATGETTE